MGIERQEGKRPLDDWTSHKHLVLRYQNWQNIMQYSSRTLNGFISAEMSDQRQRPPLHQQDHQLVWAPPICTAQCPGSREQAAEFVATCTNPIKPATPQPPSVQTTFISPWSWNLPHPQHLLLMGHYSNELALPPLNSQPIYTEWWNQGWSSPCLAVFIVLISSTHYPPRPHIKPVSFLAVLSLYTIKFF